MKRLTEIPRNLRAAGIALALVALLIALVAIPNTASPISAQDSEPPEACGPGKEPNDPPEVYDRGKLLLFDAYWDTVDKVLHNNLCPAEYTVTVDEDPITFEKTTIETFSETKIDVTKTIIQVDDTYEHTLTDQDVARYSFLVDDETDVGVGSTVWWLRLGDTPGTDPVEEASGLQLGFFTGRLKSDNWAKGGDAPLGYRFESVREDEDPEREHGHFYAFEPVATSTGKGVPIWNSENAATDEVWMQPHDGSAGYTSTKQFYEWVFSKPGEYILEVHLRGYVSDGSDISVHETESSEVVRYTFHVGPMIDLAVDLEGTLTEAATSSESDTVFYTVTASNSGLDAATNPVVQVNLPEGLEFVHDDTPNTQVLQNNGTVTWNVGELDAAATTTLTFTADVTSEGEGAKLTADAEIRDLKYNELDEDSSNNTATASVAPADITWNGPPIWSVERSVLENSSEGTTVGAPVAAQDPDMDTLVYSLSGEGADNFAVDANGQITVAADANLDYETKWSYQLTLHVSDGRAADNAEEATATNDQSMAVNIALEDVDENTRVTLSGSVSTTTPKTVTVTATLTDLPDGYTGLEFTFSERNPSGIWHTQRVSEGDRNGEIVWQRGSGDIHNNGTYYYIGFAIFTTEEGDSVTVHAHPINVEVR